MAYRFGQISPNEFILYEPKTNVFSYTKVDDVEKFCKEVKEFKMYLVKYKISTGKDFLLLKRDLVVSYIDEDTFTCKNCLVLGVDTGVLIHERTRSSTFKVQGSNQDVFKSDITSICISPTVTRITPRVIDRFPSIEYLYIPASVTSLGDDSISDCGKLKEIYFTNYVDFKQCIRSVHKCGYVKIVYTNENGTISDKVRNIDSNATYVNV